MTYWFTLIQRHRLHHKKCNGSTKIQLIIKCDCTDTPRTSKTTLTTRFQAFSWDGFFMLLGTPMRPGRARARGQVHQIASTHRQSQGCRSSRRDRLSRNLDLQDMMEGMMCTKKTYSWSTLPHFELCPILSIKKTLSPSLDIKKKGQSALPPVFGHKKNTHISPHQAIAHRGISVSSWHLGPSVVRQPSLGKPMIRSERIKIKIR